MAADSFQVESSRPDLVIKHAIRLVGTVETFQPYVDVIFSMRRPGYAFWRRIVSSGAETGLFSLNIKSATSALLIRGRFSCIASFTLRCCVKLIKYHATIIAGDSRPFKYAVEPNNSQVLRRASILPLMQY